MKYGHGYTGATHITKVFAEVIILFLLCENDFSTPSKVYHCISENLIYCLGKDGKINFHPGIEPGT